MVTADGIPQVVVECRVYRQVKCGERVAAVFRKQRIKMFRTAIAPEERAVAKGESLIVADSGIEVVVEQWMNGEVHPDCAVSAGMSRQHNVSHKGSAHFIESGVESLSVPCCWQRVVAESVIEGGVHVPVNKQRVVNHRVTLYCIGDCDGGVAYAIVECLTIKGVRQKVLNNRVVVGRCG